MKISIILSNISNHSTRHFGFLKDFRRWAD